ncbi:unnamed protein product [Clonostachys rosea f. rosea IK726]|uniref:Uncharacterized protein n=1 Tax=Clonostachys rosea f. rosea IK726 TaxID=1349383 RepID=A0ACA9U489_BIOOC|nr:unnamed protein product [Clonostachys rosea f. rosea IK726]
MFPDLSAMSKFKIEEEPGNIDYVTVGGGIIATDDTIRIPRVCDLKPPLKCGDEASILFIIGGDLDRSDQRALIPGISNRSTTIDGGKGLGDSSVTKSRI